jgi:hypothetical protein
MSPFYFDMREAEYLRDLNLPNIQKLLGDALRDMLDYKAADGASTAVCA